MKLIHTVMMLQTADFSQQVSHKFRLRSNCLCNYLSRRCKVAKIETERFNTICVEGGRNIRPLPVWMTQNKSVMVSVKFDEDRYEQVAGDEEHEFYIDIMHRGLHSCEKAYLLPLDQMNEFIEEFRKGGYLNKWVFKRRAFRKEGIEARLLCTMDFDWFRLRLHIERGGAKIFGEEILREIPNELCYHYQFKDIVIQDNKIVVPKRREITFENLFELPLDKLPA